MFSEFVANWTRSYFKVNYPRDYFELGHLKRFIYADQYICLWFTHKQIFPCQSSTTETILTTVHRILDTRFLSNGSIYQINLHLEEAYSLRVALFESRSLDVKTLGVLFLTTTALEFLYTHCISPTPLI